MAESEKQNPEEKLDFKDTEVQILGNARIVAKYSGTSPASSCAVFPDNSFVAFGWSNGVIEIRNSENFDEVHRLGKPNDMPATSLSATTDGEKQFLLSSFASGETIMWDVTEGKELWKVTEEDRQSLVVDFNSDTSLFAVGGSDAKISVFDPSYQKLVQVLQGSMDPDVMDGHNMRVFSLRFHPTRQNEIISGGWDDTIQFWDVRESFSRRKIRGPHMCGDGIEFIDDNQFITASWMKRNPLQIWDYRKNKLVGNVKPDDLTCFLYCCRYLEPQSLLFTGGSHKNMVRVIDFKTLKSLATFRDLNGAVYFVRELPKDPAVFATKFCFCSDTTVYVADIDA